MEGLLLYEMPEMMQHIVSRSGNNICTDCNVEGPDWASLSFGTLLCLQCAGYHRAFGTHVTLVRSLKLDSWSDSQMRCLEVGGNDIFNKFVKGFCDKKNLRCGHLYQSPNKYFIPEILYYRFKIYI
jgi:ADP-ribosylation factor GTPase-activating protein 1